MLDFYQITKFFDEHSPLVLSIATLGLVGMTAYYAIQTRLLTKNQLRPSFSRSLTGYTQKSQLPQDISLHLKNVGIGAAFNIHVEYSIKGIKNSKQTFSIRDIDHNKEDHIPLVQNGHPLQNDRLVNRVIEVNLAKYEGISWKYKTKF